MRPAAYSPKRLGCARIRDCAGHGASEELAHIGKNDNGLSDLGKKLLGHSSVGLRASLRAIAVSLGMYDFVGKNFWQPLAGIGLSCYIK